MVKARKYVVTKHFDGMPKRSDFKIEEYETPPLPANHILVKVEWVSVDPYIRTIESNYKLPQDHFGPQIGIVQESKNKDYPVGTRVVSNHGWCDYCIIDPNIEPEKFKPYEGSNFAVICFGAYKLPDLEGLPTSYGIGAVGLTGATAYFGLLIVLKPEEGETVVITTAAGAVGSIAGQIAKIKGCRVIGFTGSDAKAKWLTEELGFDKAFNYKTEDVAVALHHAAPDGIDCFFDNVGGELSYVIMKQMNYHGRVALCGSISAHDEVPSGIFPPNVFQPIVLVRQLKVQGLLVFRWITRWPEAFAELTEWIKSGKLKVREHVTEGFDNVVDAYEGMLKGDNFGKAVVKIS